jgi:hypothetical protein
MARTVRNVKNSLKFKAQPKQGIISVRVGVKKYTVPVEARILSNSEHIFLSFPAVSELYKITDNGLEPMDVDADATEAYNSLNPGKKRGRRRGEALTLPPQLAEALKSLPAGHKIGYDADGTPRLVKTRKRGRR